MLGNNVWFKAPQFSIDSTQNGAHVNILSQARSILIEGFSFWDLLVSNEIGVDKLTIDSANIHITLPQEKPYQNSQKEINLFVKEIFTSIRVKQLELVDVNVVVTKRNRPDTILILNHFELKADEVLVDTATVTNIFPLSFQRSEVRINEMKFTTQGEYLLSGKNLLIKDTSLMLSNLKLSSIYSKKEFTSHQQYEKARIELNVTKLISRNLLWDYDEQGFSVYSSKSNLEKPFLSVYKDKRPPDQPKQVKPLLTELIRKLPFILTIDTITASDSYIEYEQFPVQFPRSGKVFFDNMYISAYNLSNDSMRIGHQSDMTIDVQTDFMGQSRLTTNINLDLASPKQEFSVSGKLGSLPVTYINQVMTPLVGVTAEGTIHKLIFDFAGNEYKATGGLQCEYSDLKVTMFDDGRDKELIRSMFGNLLLKNNNQKDDTLNYKEGEIYFIRYQNKDFFNYLWNSVRVGLMDIVVPFYQNPDLRSPPTDPKFKEDS